jgi:hypothetical protein
MRGCLMRRSAYEETRINVASLLASLSVRRGQASAHIYFGFVELIRSASATLLVAEIEARAIIC